jgi:beta-lactam-binding protein with PASTA domain
VPRLIGLKVGVAKRRIRRARCRVGTVRRVRSRRTLRGRVVRQSPRPGTVRRVGFHVNIWVGRR